MATNQNTTSRRAVVAGLALSPAAAFPAISGPLAADPVVPAFARWQEAEARYRAAYAVYDAKDEEWQKVSQQYPNHIDLGGCFGHKYNHDDINKQFDILAHIYDIPASDRHFIDALAQSARDRLDAVKARHDEARAAMGITAADEEVEATARAARQAEDELVALTPTTTAGALLYVEFMGRVVPKESIDEDQVATVFANLSAFLKSGGANV